MDDILLIFQLKKKTNIKGPMLFLTGILALNQVAAREDSRLSYSSVFLLDNTIRFIKSGFTVYEL